MIRIKESFSSGLPKWLTKDRTVVRYLNDKDVDLNKATYVPDVMISSSGDKRLKDSNKIQVFLLKDEHSNLAVYILGTEGPYVNIGGRRALASKFSMKTLLSIADEYGYIDISDATNTKTAIKAQRRDTKAGSIDRGKGQYKMQRYAFNNGRRIPIGYDWFNTEGEDKSGYKLPDPKKYIKMLNQVDKSNYGRRITSIYNRVKEVKSSIDDIEISLGTGVDVSNINTGAYVSDLHDQYSGLISSYCGLLKNCKKAVEKDNDYYFNQTIDRRKSFDNFIEDVEDVEYWIVRCKKALRIAKSRSEIPAYY